MSGNMMIEKSYWFDHKPSDNNKGYIYGIHYIDFEYFIISHLEAHMHVSTIINTLENFTYIYSPYNSKTGQFKQGTSYFVINDVIFQKTFI